MTDKNCRNRDEQVNVVMIQTRKRLKKTAFFSFFFRQPVWPSGKA